MKLPQRFSLFFFVIVLIALAIYSIDHKAWARYQNDILLIYLYDIPDDVSADTVVSTQKSPAIQARFEFWNVVFSLTGPLSEKSVFPRFTEYVEMYYFCFRIFFRSEMIHPKSSCFQSIFLEPPFPPPRIA